MATFNGRLWMVADRESKLRVDIHLDAKNLKITSNDVVIGDWPISEMVVREIGNTNLRMSVEGEEVTVSSRHPQFMPSVLEALGVGRDSHAASRRTTPSFNAPGVSSDEENAESQSTLPSRDLSSGKSSSISETGREDPKPQRTSRKGAHRSRRRVLWRGDLTAR